MARGRNSFTPGEVTLLAYICGRLLQSQPPDLRLVQKHPEFQTLARKCIAMRQSVAEQKAEEKRIAAEKKRAAAEKAEAADVEAEERVKQAAKSKREPSRA